MADRKLPWQPPRDSTNVTIIPKGTSMNSSRIGRTLAVVTATALFASACSGSGTNATQPGNRASSNDPVKIGFIGTTEADAFASPTWMPPGINWIISAFSWQN